MGQFDDIVARATARYKLPGWLLPRVIGQESGGDPTATSSAGAQGVMQLMPATAKGLGVTDIRDPAQNIDAGAHYLRQQLDAFGTVPLALAAYNAGPGAVRSAGNQIPNFSETQNYVRNIMASAGADGGAVSPSAPAASVSHTTPPPATTPLLSPAALAIINRGNTSLGLPPLMLPPARAAPATTPPGAAGGGGASTTPARDVSGIVHVASSANRAGVNLHPQVVSFVADIAHIYGHPLTIGTGTNHNQYVKDSRRESAHWTGWAADVPATGDALTKLGHSALIAAGMNPRQAVAAAKRGGLFNVNGYQIIFKSNIGGNHYNHLHVGVSPSRQLAA